MRAEIRNADAREEFPSPERCHILEVAEDAVKETVLGAADPASLGLMTPTL
jgi:hypothetical protein